MFQIIFKKRDAQYCLKKKKTGAGHYPLQEKQVCFSISTFYRNMFQEKGIRDDQIMVQIKPFWKYDNATNPCIKKKKI